MTDIRLLPNRGISISIDSKPHLLEAPEWLLKHAIGVASQPHTRMVTLLLAPNDRISNTLKLGPYAQDQLFWIGVHPSLADTKTGEALILIDILLTDPARFSKHGIDLGGVNSQLGIPIKTPSREAVSRFERENVRQFEESEVDVVNWTWADEKNTYNWMPADDKILVKGTPSFWFLDEDRKLAWQQTRFYQRHVKDIYEIHPAAFEISTRFAQLLAFFRYLSEKQPSAWKSTLELRAQLEDAPGDTPAFVPKLESVEDWLLKRKPGEGDDDLRRHIQSNMSPSRK